MAQSNHRRAFTFSEHVRRGSWASPRRAEPVDVSCPDEPGCRGSPGNHTHVFRPVRAIGNFDIGLVNAGA